MSDLWNLWDVKPPPICSVKTKLHFKGITNLNEVTYSALKTVRDVNPLDREAAILSRFLYRYRRIFRQDKGIQNLVKVIQCLKKYLKLNMVGTLFDFKQCLAHNFKQTTTFAYLPTRQMLKWVLLRLQAFAQLFARVIELAKETGAYVYKKLWLGWSLNLSLLVFSAIARILTMSKFLVAKSIEWYSSFYKCLPHLQETADFLPNYEFPLDLKLWLGKLDLAPLKKKTFADDILELLDLVNEDEDKEEEAKVEENPDEVRISNEKFIKILFKVEQTQIDSDVEEIIEEETKEQRKGMKRPLRTYLQDEDLGVLVDDKDENEEKPDASGRTGKRFKKRKGGKRVKWLNKVKKTVETYERKGMSEGSLLKDGSSQNFGIPYLTID